MANHQINIPEEEEAKIVIEDEEGEKHLFEVLFTFDVDSTGKSYMVLTPEGSNESDEEEMEVYPVRYEEQDEEDYKLIPIDTDEEWEMVEELLNTFSEQEMDE
ncbi:uncharacterized protein YrzB (UPF0473 family) [Evansella vedderi]|uniref:UPF0473 protein J2S74_001658 n=1 Tax=Evansella vedderi TaxID=38282 RepID=A0ABT9ZSR8_9BACI|nr:DUF1292 domain-containing protein [Evansella vedderi]MDQ0254283.1 uncharacterized protein YrzB (UPF0473 family) [Evansella vedderi]